MTWLAAAWAVFFAAFYISHCAVKAAGGVRPEKHERRDRWSDGGLGLQFLGVAAAWWWPGDFRLHLLPLALALAIASTWLVWSALRQLGRQWRVRAIVTDDHQLVTSGPYRWVRHPIYSAFIGMLIATALCRVSPALAALAVALFCFGTEIRVRAEERILAGKFGEAFDAFRRQTRWAYLPGLR